MRKSIKDDDNLNSKIVPTLEIIENVKEFYGNAHLKIKKSVETKTLGDTIVFELKGNK